MMKTYSWKYIYIYLKKKESPRTHPLSTPLLLKIQINASDFFFLIIKVTKLFIFKIKKSVKKLKLYQNYKRLTYKNLKKMVPIRLKKKYGFFSKDDWKKSEL